MKLVSFKAQNYRSLKNFELDLGQFLVLIGENNSGKSTIFRALDLFLSSTVKGVDDDSFYNHDITLPINLTACFDSLSKEEEEKLEPWVVDGKLTVKKEYKRDSGKTGVSYFALLRVPKDKWLNEDYDDYNNRNIVSTLPIGKFIPPTVRITKEIYKGAIKKYIECYGDGVEYLIEERKNPAGYKQVLDGYLPEFYLVPAVRDVSEEVKTSSGALLGKLIGLLSKKVISSNPKFRDLQRAISELSAIMEGETPEEKLQEIKDLESMLKKALSDWDVGVNIHIKSPNFLTLLQSGVHVELDDGLPTSIEEKGNGLQRSLIFALMRVWAEISHSDEKNLDSEIRERSIMFAFEEPELYLHPQIGRVTYQALKTLSSTYQILLCTHSAHFVNLEDYRDIVVIRKLNQTEGTSSYKTSGELFEDDYEQKQRFNMIQFFNPDRSEVFFAKRVALVEGATEKALFPLLARRLNMFDYRISIIDCGGKHNLTLYMKVLNAFKIPSITLYDEDPIPSDICPGAPNYEHEKYRTRKRLFELNAKIEQECDRTFSTTHMFPGELEDMAGISKSHADKVGKPYAAIEKYSDSITKIPQNLKDAVREIYG
jgi:CRISPR-associated exonuclease Cas4